MEIIEELAELARTRPGKLKKQKEKGAKLVGYIGRFIPEELIHASGAVPYLLCRGGQPEPPDAVIPYMLRFMSPYARSQIGYYLLGIDPVVPMLDLIVVQCSDCHEGRLGELIEYLKLPTAKVGVPPDWKKSLSQEYYYKALARLKEKLENLTGNRISDTKLSESIVSFNKVREIFKKISLLQRAQPPLISGYDFIRLNHYSFYCDLEELLPKLDALYSQLHNGKSPFPEGAPRILLAGHVVSVGDYVVPRLIEASGGVIVGQFLDEGTRHCDWNVGVDGDLMRNLGETYYLERTPPTVFQPVWEERIEVIKKLLKDLQADGVIWYQLSFEEIYDMEGAIISKAMDEMKVPFLKLESSYEYAREAMGPLTTRIESFIESIRQKRG